MTKEANMKTNDRTHRVAIILGMAMEGEGVGVAHGKSQESKPKSETIDKIIRKYIYVV